MANSAFDVITRGIDDRKVVAAGGTPVQLVTAITPCAGVWLCAESDNTGVMAVGFSNAVRAALGSQKGARILAAREGVFIHVADASALWIDASVSSDGVVFSIVQRVEA